MSNLPDKVIGSLGGGYDDDFANKLIVIAVLRSAAVKLPKTIDPSIADHLLLVVDECHNAGSQENRKVFNIKRVYNLGLSATPEREDYIEEDDDNEDVTFDSDYNNSLLGTELGPIIYEMTLKQAYDLGLLPRYELQHIGLSLEREEGQKYEMLSRSIKDLTSQLTDVAAIKGRGTYRGNRFIAWCQTMAKTDGDTGTLAREFIFKTGERKRLLYLAKSREEAVVKILRKEFADNPSARVILFHESIDGVMSIYLRLMNEGFEVVVENSELSQSLRETSIETFRSEWQK